MSENIFYDVIVVGGGPGGSTAAAFLAKKGRKVLILEKAKFPRDKTCGDAISGKSLGILDELSLRQAVEASDHGEATKLVFSSPNGKHVTIPMGDGKKGEIRKSYTCRRMVYDNLLWQNAKKLADSYEGTEVIGVIREASAPQQAGEAANGNGQENGNAGAAPVGNTTKAGQSGTENSASAVASAKDGGGKNASGTMQPSAAAPANAGAPQKLGKICGVRAKGADGREQEFHGKIIIGADGVSSLIAREARGPKIIPEHTCVAYRAYYSGVKTQDAIEVHFVKSIMPGYFWIFPLENGLANVGIGMRMSEVSKNKVNLQMEMEKIISENPLFKERFAGAKMVSKLQAWSLPLGSTHRQVHSDNVLLVGDAAGLVDPFSGEGIGNAMLSGKLAAQVADEALSAGDTTAPFLSTYEQRLWKEIDAELQLSYTMQRLGSQQWLLDLVVGKAASSEKAREAIGGTFLNSEAKKGYANPMFYLKLLLS